MRNYLILLFGLVAMFACNPKESNENKQTDNDSIKVQKDELTLLSEKIEKDDNNPELYNERAKLYMSKGAIDQAFADIRNAMLIDSTSAAILETYADIQFTLGKPSETKAALLKAIEVEPEYVNSYLKLAELHFYYKEYKQVFNYTSKAMKLDKKIPKTYFIRGMAFLENGRKEKAIESFQEVINLDPEYYKAFIELGFIYAKDKNILAESYFKGALNINPRSIEALYALGMFYQDANRAEDAINTYNMLLDVDSLHRFAHYNIGYVHMVLEEDFEKAIPFFEKAIEITPDYIQAYYNQAHCFELLGKYREAEVIYKQALEVNSEYDRAIEGLNRVQNKLYR